jgi:hypothetical protein
MLLFGFLKVLHFSEVYQQAGPGDPTGRFMGFGMGSNILSFWRARFHPRQVIVTVWVSNVWKF